MGITSRHDLKPRLGRQSLALIVIALLLLSADSAFAQDWIRTGTGLGVERVRLAASDFKPSTADAKNADLLKTFNDVLWNDLDNAGIFDLVSKSFYPLQEPGQPSEVNFSAWNSPPPNTSMLAFGNLGAAAGKVTVQGWLYDVKNEKSPQVLGKQYTDNATTDAVRVIAHRFADEIIFRLGGGVAGIAESKIYFVSERTGHKEIWMMDYDGANQQQITHLGSISLSPRISPDGSRLAFSSINKGGWEIMMYSFDLNRMVAFPRFGGMNLSPSWSPDGKIAFSSSRNGYPNIFAVDRIWRKFAAPDQRPWAGCFAHLESQDRRPDRFRQRTHRPAADLYHGSGRHQLAARHRSRLCGFSQLVAQRAVSDLFLDAQVRAGRAGFQRPLFDGRRQQAVGAAHARRGAQRFSLLVAGRPPHCVSVPPLGQRPDMDHAGGRHQCEAIDVSGRQHAAQLELEVD